MEQRDTRQRKRKRESGLERYIGEVLPRLAALQTSQEKDLLKYAKEVVACFFFYDAFKKDTEGCDSIYAQAEAMLQAAAAEAIDALDTHGKDRLEVVDELHLLSTVARFNLSTASFDNLFLKRRCIDQQYFQFGEFHPTKKQWPPGTGVYGVHEKPHLWKLVRELQRQRFPPKLPAIEEYINDDTNPVEVKRYRHICTTSRKFPKVWHWDCTDTKRWRGHYKCDRLWNDRNIVLLAWRNGKCYVTMWWENVDSEGVEVGYFDAPTDPKMQWD